MALEEKQLKNIRNRFLDYLKTIPPQKLVELALLCKIKVPEPLMKKYSQEGKE